jgi:SulP family sulfate permease
VTDFSVLDVTLIGQLAPGALAIAAIGLVEAMSIARSIAGQSNQRLESNQEFVGQGLANIAAGVFSGYPSSGSFTRSAVNFDAGARTRLASVFSGLFVLIAMLAFAPMAAYVPRAALSGVLILTAYSMIDRKEIARIWRGARADAVIMIITFLATLFLHLEFAVLGGILLSFAIYIVKTSVPRVSPVLPDERFRHFVHQPQKPPCPQLAILDILGDLYFGAVSHVEQAIEQHLAANPYQRTLLLRMLSVQNCDFSGIHALECIVRSVRERGGHLFLVRVREPVLDLMRTTGFYDYLGRDHFLEEDEAVSHLFYKVLDPAICIYECDVRAFKECQNLPKQKYPAEIPLHTDIPAESVALVSPRDLWQQLQSKSPPLIIDVRERREFDRSHIPQARLIPLPRLFCEEHGLPQGQPLVFVCRGGRRSTRAAYMVQNQGYEDVAALQGGMAGWEAAGLLAAVDTLDQQGGSQ